MAWMNNIDNYMLKQALGIINTEDRNKEEFKIIDNAVQNKCIICSSLSWRKEISCNGFSNFGCNNKEIYKIGLCKDCYDNSNHRSYKCRKCEERGVLSYNLLCHYCNEFEHTKEIEDNDLNTTKKIYWSTYHCEPIKSKCKECGFTSYIHLDMKCVSCRNAEIRIHI